MGKIILFIRAYKYIWFLMILAVIGSYAVETNPGAEKLLIEITEKITGEYINENHEF